MSPTLTDRGLFPPLRQPLVREYADDGLMEHDRSGAIAAGSALVFDRDRQAVIGPRGEAELTPLESALLSILARQPGALVFVAEIARVLWDYAETDGYVRDAIRTHVYTLRKKLDRVGLEGALETRRGLGYRLLAGAALV